MDKRFLSALLLCFVIVVGWTLLFPPPKPTVPDGSNTTARTEAPAAESTTTESSQANPATLPAGTQGRVVRDTEARTQTFLIGEPGSRWLLTATNEGATLVEARREGHAQKSGTSAADAQKPENWVLLLSTVNTGRDPSRSLVWRAGPSAKSIAGEGFDKALWVMRPVQDKGQDKGIEWEYAPGTGMVFTKRLIAEPGAKRLRLELELKNESSNEAGRRDFVLVPAAGMQPDSGDSFYKEPEAIAWSAVSDDADGLLAIEQTHETGEVSSGTLQVPAPIGWAGVHTKYYAALLSGQTEADRATLLGAGWRAQRDEAWLSAHPDMRGREWRQLETELTLGLDVPQQGAVARTWRYDYYLGTKNRDELKAADPTFRHLIDHDLGFVSGIAKALLAVLGFFHTVTNSWGFAIILLTIFVRLVLFPINRRSQTAMSKYQSKMKRIQPRIDELKKKHANDPSRLRQEQAKIMQEEGAFPPLGGCLPPLLQIPIFIGLFRAVGVSFDLRHETFLGLVQDLSLPDQLIPFGFDLPFFGPVAALNILPPIMVVMWIWQQRSMPMPSDEQAQMMYKMMMWMPVVMGIFLYNYAAGLSLYMITQSTLGIIEIKVIKKYWPIDEKEEPKKKDGFLARMMKEQQRRLEEIEKQRGKKK